ncbi:hypothetical protein PC128_g19306 [Phytophthora cactorum]|nr:hypothetical protein PC128_g19306 [Phytophthora cactorum]
MHTDQWSIASQYEWLPQFRSLHPPLAVAPAVSAGRRQVDFEVPHDGHLPEGINSLLYAFLTMRQQLDGVCYRMGWPILDAEHYDEDDMEATMRDEK